MMRTALAVVCVLSILPAVDLIAAENNQPRAVTHMRVEVDGVTIATLRGCEEFGSETAVVQVTGGNGGIVSKVPGATNFLNIVCSANLTSDKTLANWRKQVETGQIANARKDGALVMLDSVGQEVTRYVFTDGWPNSLKVKWDGASAGAPATETISIVIENLARQ
jgi:phage tail-like protein